MKKVKITVLKTTFDKELAKEYGADGLTACPMLKEGPTPIPLPKAILLVNCLSNVKRRTSILWGLC